MARSQLQIENSMISSIVNIDPGIDATKGPLRGAFIQPQAAALAEQEAKVDDLSLRYSLQYVRTRNPDIMDLYAFNHGMLRASGTPSFVTGFYFTYSKPPEGSSILIPQGSTVTTPDQTITFQTVEDVQIPSEAFEVYFSSTRRRYEIPSLMRSIGIGEEFEISAGRLQQLLSPVPGIVGFFQPVASSPSSTLESTESLGTRQQAKLVGLALGTGGGLESVIRDFDPSRILDVAVVFSTEDLFKRPTRRPAYDVYLVGTENGENLLQFTAIGGELSVQLTKVPAISLISVTVNGTEIAGAVLKSDTTPYTGDSTRANDRVVFPAALTGGDVVAISYTYDLLLNTVQDFISSANRNYWKTDILLREAVNVEIAITVDVTALSSFDTTNILALIEQAIFTTINLNTMGLTYYPSAIRSNIANVVAGLSTISISRFERVDAKGVIPVDVIETLANEFATVSVIDLVININT